jgi:hypothetical protein
MDSKEEVDVEDYMTRASLLLRLERILSFERTDEVAVALLHSEFRDYRMQPNKATLRLDAWSRQGRVPANLKLTDQPLPHSAVDRMEQHMIDLKSPFTLHTPFNALIAMTWFPTVYNERMLSQIFDMLLYDHQCLFSCSMRDGSGTQPISRFGFTGSSMQLFRAIVLEIGKNYEVNCTPDCRCIICRFVLTDCHWITVAQHDDLILECLARFGREYDWLSGHPLLIYALTRRFHKSTNFLLRSLHDRLRDGEIVKLQYWALEKGSDKLAEGINDLILRDSVNNENITFVQRSPELTNFLMGFEVITSPYRDNESTVLARNTLTSLIKINAAEPIFAWLIPRLPTCVLNGYDEKGDTPLIRAVRMWNPHVISLLMKEPLHRVDFCAETITMHDQKVCLPHIHDNTLKTNTGVAACHLIQEQANGSGVMTRLKVLTHYQQTIYYPKRVNCICLGLDFLPAVIHKIIVRQCGLPVPVSITAVTANPNPGKRKREEEDQTDVKQQKE